MSDKNIILRDKDIREPFHNWLREKHPDLLDTKIFHEFPIPRPSARVDIAVVNGQLSGFEIKSDADTLGRLPRQVASFNCVFDRMAIVTTRRHLDSVLRIVPEWWGVCVARDDGTFKERRKGRVNRKQNIKSVLYLLSKEELLFAVDCCGNVNCRKSDRRDQIVSAIADSIPYKEILDTVRLSLKRRESSSVS